MNMHLPVKLRLPRSLSSNILCYGIQRKFPCKFPFSEYELNGQQPTELHAILYSLSFLAVDVPSDFLDLQPFLY